jgi:hypothetical protein
MSHVKELSSVALRKTIFHSSFVVLRGALYHFYFCGSEKRPLSTYLLPLEPNQFTIIPFSVGKKLIKKQLELKHQGSWAACTGCRQFKVLMRHPLPSRANELLALSKLIFRAAVGLSTGHTSLSLYKLGHAEWQECRLCGNDK